MILVDLSKSVDVKGPDGATPYQRNLAAVSSLLAKVPAGSQVTIVGITDHSFAQPDILLSARVGTDAGFFNEKLSSARQVLVRAWRSRCRHLQHDFQHTDILGALLLAAQIFHRSQVGQNQLVIFSDMRQSSPQFSLDNLESVLLDDAFLKLENEELIPELNGVEVRVKGVDNVGKKVTQWKMLKRFWVRYFEKAGAVARIYSILTD